MLGGLKPLQPLGVDGPELTTFSYILNSNGAIAANLFTYKHFILVERFIHFIIIYSLAFVF